MDATKKIKKAHRKPRAPDAVARAVLRKMALRNDITAIAKETMPAIQSYIHRDVKRLATLAAEYTEHDKHKVITAKDVIAAIGDYDEPMVI